MKIEKEFIPYEQALALKKLRFDEPCLGNYKKTGGLHILHYGTCGSTKSDNFNILAPLYQQAFRWFREKHNLHSYIEGMYPWCRYYINSDDNRWEGFKELKFEEAELECLKKLIKIIKTK